MALAIPGITWQGTRGDATHELAVQIDASWMRLLPGAEPKEWWQKIAKMVVISDTAEVVKLIVDMEDLGVFKRRVGPRTAGSPPKLTKILMPREPWYRDRNIPLADIKRDNFGQWPDKLAALLLASRRTPGMIFAELLSAATTTTKTLQGIPLIGTGHKCNFNDSNVTTTFDNLIVGNSASSTPGTMDANGFEYGQEQMFSRLGPDGVHGLDQEITYVLGGTKMKKMFNRQFKRVLVLDETSTAAVTNIHQELIEGGVVAIVTSWLDRTPFKVANPTLDQWWSFSSTTEARAIGIMTEGGPRVDIFDEGSEYAREHEHVWIKADMDANGGAAFPQVITEHRGA